MREATIDDIEGVLDVLESVAAEERFIATEAPVDRPARKKSFTEQILSPDSVIFIAEGEGRIVGNAVAHGMGPTGMGVAILSEFRGRGIGSRLLEACIEWARAAGSHKITLEVWPHNEAAIALYRKHGFEQEGYLRKHWRRRSGELWDSIIMGLLLDDRP